MTRASSNNSTVHNTHARLTIVQRHRYKKRILLLTIFFLLLAVGGYWWHVSYREMPHNWRFSTRHPAGAPSDPNSIPLVYVSEEGLLINDAIEWGQMYSAPFSFTMYDWNGGHRWQVSLPAIKDTELWPSFHLSPSGEYLVMALRTREAALKVTTWRNGKLYTKYTLPLSRRAGYDLQVLDKGGVLVVSLVESTVKLFYLEGGQLLAQGNNTLRLHVDTQEDATCSIAPDGKTIAFGKTEDVEGGYTIAARGLEYATLHIARKQITITNRYLARSSSLYYAPGALSAGFVVSDEGEIFSRGRLQPPRKAWYLVHNRDELRAHSALCWQREKRQAFQMVDLAGTARWGSLDDGDAIAYSPNGRYVVQHTTPVPDFRYRVRQRLERLKVNPRLTAALLTTAETQHSDFVLVEQPGRKRARLPVRLTMTRMEDKLFFAGMGNEQFYSYNNCYISSDGRQMVLLARSKQSNQHELLFFRR